MNMHSRSLPPTPDSCKNHEEVLDLDKISAWPSVAARRRHEILVRIPKDYFVDHALLSGTNQSNLVRRCGLLSDRELSIIELTATELLKRIHNRIFTSVEVTKAFCKSAAVAHQAV